MRPLRDIEVCFQGVIPCYLATCSPEGVPNVTALSVAHLLGPNRVGLSCQFLNKSLRNLRSTGVAQLLVMDPTTLVEYRIDIRFLGLNKSGKVFEAMEAHLAGIAAQTGMEDIFELQGVVECEVLRWESTSLEAEARAAEIATDPLELLERVASSIHAAADVDTLVESTLLAIREHLGLEHGFLLLTDGTGDSLYTVASRGFGDARIGAEIRVGEGFYGVCAERGIAMRTGSFRRERLFTGALARERSDDPRFLPLPGLLDVESTVAIPLACDSRCVGVLCFQSASPGAFTSECERMLVIIARHLAAMMQVLGVASNAEIEVSGRRGPVGSRAMAMRVRYYEADGSVFVDNEYVIKGVAGRILWRVLSAFHEEQRDEFLNKEIRLDKSLGLPDLKDNLEARLIALRRRLAERTPQIRIDKAGRGRFRLEVDRALILECVAA